MTTGRRYTGLWRRPPTGDWAVFSFTVVWAVGVLLPLVGVIGFSFVRANAAGVSLSISLNAYAEIFTTGRWEVTARTVRITATVTLVLLAIAFPFALWLAKGVRSRFLKLVIWTLLTAPFFLSDTARIVIWRPVLGLMGPINSTLVGLGLTSAPLPWLLFSEPAVHFGLLGPYLPNMIWPIFLSITLIDDELLEASKDIGASPWQTFRYVVLPLSMPGVVSGIVFTFVPMLGDDVVSKVLGGQQVEMLGGAMLDLITALNYSVAAAMSAFVLVLIAVLQALLIVVLRRVGGDASLMQGLRR